jgi:hypothetical protein
MLNLLKEEIIECARRCLWPNLRHP